MRAFVTAAAFAAAVAGAPARAADDPGRVLYESRCGGCHSLDASRVGPMHRGVVGRRAGSVAGFDYSLALRSAGFAWDAAKLDQWLADPESLVPGQRMGYRLSDATERAAVIAYLAAASRAQ